ncbi:hypothetical protein T265_04932 [Opisthorchis viverrini]|uniref:Uncharacterized protein n=1 Tax=Opisthorchis viverrini TaxID=6198 RepID=A0A074ZLG8_OPIVI|nr:hypothetical protein T265_04932 [Opisthorchis viverrini]KER28173.1 hypothetical protein T265_04932 [Opisthorchis viverrini]
MKEASNKKHGSESKGRLCNLLYRCPSVDAQTDPDRCYKHLCTTYAYYDPVDMCKQNNNAR